MKRIAEDDERRGRRVDVTFVGMAVPQQHEFLEHEEGEDADEQRAEYR